MRVWPRVLIVAVAVAGALAPIDPRLVERWYSTGLFPVAQRLLTPVSNLVPFAWLDTVVALAIVTIIVTLVQAVRKARRQQVTKSVFRALGRLLTWAAAVYLLFLALWGLNYRRVPLTERLIVDGAPPSAVAVLALGRQAVDRLNALSGAAHAQGWRTAPWRDHRLGESYAGVLGALSDAPAAVPGRLKWSIFGPYFRWTSVDGMINPFGLEAIGNPDLLPFERPFVAAHEWAHLAGYADESEASFVGFLSCVRADSASAYSGWLFLYWQVQSEIGPADRKQLASALTVEPRRDVEAVAERLRRSQVPLLRDASWRVYDKYLKANRVEEGVRSYDAVIALLVRARFEDGWRPVRQK